MRERRAIEKDGVNYAPGARFRVVRLGLKLTGMTSVRGGGHQGWSQELQVGDVLTCTGFGEGWGSDPGYGVEFTTELSLAARASHCDTYPSVGGIWAYRPPPGYLELLESVE